MPRLLSDPSRYALEEAVPGPSDVSAGNPGVGKLRYNVPVVIKNKTCYSHFAAITPGTSPMSWPG
jgi:hypothetical protein